MVNESEWRQFAHLFQREEVKAKTTLLREGEVSKRALWIEKGCVRVWFNNNGTDVTFQFFFEGDGVSSIESFQTGQPSLFSIETIEPCILHSVSKTDFQQIMDEAPAIQQQLGDIIFQRLLFYQHLFLSRIKDNPEQRYKDLLENHPKILQRVPQHYIASYLGITPVSLSRIRNRR